jgi:OOP family OmpA-OmpF porin
MKVRSKVASLVALGCLTAAGPARAQTAPGWAHNLYQPAERGSRWFTNESLEIKGRGRMAIGIVTDYSYRSLVDYRADGVVLASIVRNQLLVHPGATFTFADRVRIGVSVPLQLFVDGGRPATVGGATYAPSEDVAVGDVRLGADVKLFGGRSATGDGIEGALGAQLFVPSGSPASYTGDGEPRFLPRFLIAGQAGHIAYAARAGVMVRGREEAWADGRIGTEAQVGLSAGYVTANRKLLVGPELLGSTVFSKAFEARTTPAEVLLGARYAFTDELRIGLGAGLGLTRGYGAAVARGLLAVEWVPGDPQKEEGDKAKSVDRDGDGVADADDACGFLPGPSSPDPARSGCPVVDSDGDHVADDVDACRFVPGAHSADARLNGCPPDGDADGIRDNEDACPRDKGGPSSDPKRHGCPVIDKDGDGVSDFEDACPDAAGPKTADPKTTGCPDTDRDKDGVPNDVDACPDLAGPADANPKKNGCPKAVLEGNRIRITEQVRFATGKAQIVGPESEAVLQAVLAVLQGHPEVKRLRVEGHTDNQGKAADNKRLSQARAEAVMAWLVGKGVDKARLEAKGYGDERPIMPNSTDDGRTQNRRVELHVEEGTK